jgi:chemotaxis signal transduction protein
MRISQSLSRNGRKAKAKETVILFSVGRHTFAIAANSIDEIREVAGLRDFDCQVPKVKCTLDRQGQQYFVVDAARHFRIAGAAPARLILLRSFPVAVVVDAIDRMQEIHSIQALPEGFSGEERNWYRGLTLLKGSVVPVIRPEAFLTKAEVTLLNALKRSRESIKAVAVTA